MASLTVISNDDAKKAQLNHSDFFLKVLIVSIYLFESIIYFCLCWVFVAACRLSLVVEQGILLWWSLKSFKCLGFSRCSGWAQ